MFMKRICIVVLSISLLLCLASPSTFAQTTPPAWQSGVHYNVGDLVTFNGQTFQCRQAHTSQPDWTPPAVLALWLPVSGGSCSAVPSAPTGLTAPATSITQTSATLNWTAANASAGCTVTGYTVLENGNSIGTSTGTSFNVTGLAPASTNSFTVTAADSFGSSSQSAAVSVKTLANACKASPSAPTGLTAPAASITQTSATLNWTAANVSAGCAVTSYTVFKNGTSIGTSTGTSFNVTGLAPASTNSFTVAATDSFGTSPQSASVTVKTLANGCTSIPTVPTGLFASGTTSTSTSLQWTASNNPSGCSATSYLVFKNGVSVGTTSTTSFTVTGLAPNTTFSFTVAATNTAGASQQSSAASVTTLPQVITSGNGRLLVGYWHDFDNGTGFIPLGQVSSAYDIINVAFANASGANITFTPFQETPAQFKGDIQSLQSKGKKVLLSIGGATETITLNSSSDVSTFVSSVASIIQQYGFDGIDIDFENDSLQLDANDNNFNNPSTPQVVNLISALRQLHNQFGAHFMITFAPETFFAQLALQFYGPGPFNGANPRAGAQLAVISNIRDILTYVWTQEYQSGPIEALDGNSYTPGGPDFVVAMTEMLVHGFPVAHNAGTFAGLAPEQVVIGIPANPQAAGVGFLSDSDLESAYNYLIGRGPQPGSYKLQTPGGYPNLRGFMTWSINWDSFGGFAFSNGLRPYLNSLPQVQ
jgi:chitinase